MIYLQNGGVDYCTQNDVILTTCIRRNITYLRNDKCICSGSLAGSLSEENLRTEPQRIYLCLKKADLRTRRDLKPKKHSLSVDHLIKYNRHLCAYATISGAVVADNAGV